MHIISLLNVELRGARGKGALGFRMVSDQVHTPNNAFLSLSLTAFRDSQD